MPRGGVKKKTKVGRGPFEQCVGDFCFVPRVGVKKKRGKKCVTRWCKKEKSVGDRLSSMSGTSALCHEVAERKMENIGRGPIERCVGKFRPVPRGGVKGEKKEKKNKKRIKDSVGARLCNKFGILFFSLCPWRWRKNEKTDTYVVHIP